MNNEDLRQVNIEIARAEQHHDVKCLSGILHEALVFRRANGTVVSKAEFLAAVPGRTYDFVAVTDQQLLIQHSDMVVWNVNVRANGTANGTAFDGDFCNVRVFVRQEAGWRLLAWANSKVDPTSTLFEQP